MPTTTPIDTYLDYTRPLPERVADLIGRLTLTEKISQLRHAAPGIPRLGVPAYNYWSEALHGVSRNGRATVFPQAIGLAATWDTALIERLTTAIGDEGRAKYHAALRRHGESGYCQGLTFWSPNINIYRDPRWGRGQETYGEDPYLTGEIGATYVRGLQGDHPRYLKAAACAKHFAVHSGPEKLRHSLDAQVSPRDLHDTYLPAFRKLVVEAHTEVVMGAYNRVNGEACCAHPLLMETLLREEWGFAGHFVSDCGAVGDIARGHALARDAAEAAGLALRRGCDLECGETYGELGEALARGLITEAELDQGLTRVLGTRFKLGMFDPPELVPFTNIPLSVVGCAEHRALAREAAAKSVVLLQNRGEILPLKPSVRRLRLLGPMAANVDVLLGNYAGLNDTMTTMLEGLVAQLPEGMGFDYRPGTDAVYPNLSEQDWLFGSDQPDVAIVCLGLSPLMEGEESDTIASNENGDRSELALPPVQAAFLRRLAATGVKIVLVLTGGGPIALGDLADLVEAILFVWYPGQEGGHAVADLLFGAAVPSGKLPITFPASVDQLPPFEDYAMAGRTYRYLTTEPLYPFGFGLSYTRFEYRGLTLDTNRLAPNETLSLSLDLVNSGPLEAEEVVQCYLSDLEASAPVPHHKLVGFQRVRLAAGEQRRLAFTLAPEQLAFINEAGQAQLEPGQFRVTVGGCSPGPRGQALGAPLPVTALFTLSDHTPNSK